MKPSNALATVVTPYSFVIVSDDISSILEFASVPYVKYAGPNDCLRKSSIICSIISFLV